MKQKKAISCGVATTVKITTKSIPGGISLDVGIPGNRVVSSKILKSGSAFTFDSRFCRAGAAPH